MKKFGINAAERFIIRNHTALRRILYAIIIVLIVVVVPITVDRDIPFPAVFGAAVLLVIPVVFIDMLAAFKFMKIEKTANASLDLQSALDSAEMMLSILKPSQLDYIGTATLLKATALYDMGRRDEARACALNFLDSCDVKKAPYSQMAQNHTLLAIMALCDYDFREFEFQKSRVERCMNEAPKSSRIVFERNDILGGLDFDYRLYSSETYDGELEAQALKRPEVLKGKPIPKNKRSALSYVSAYSMLFEYFRRLDMQEKAHFYARKLQRLANEQFECFREAKEFLDNENFTD